ncbi:aldehyde dehydrogenase family protein [Mesorhizobium sp. M0830]
MSSLGFATTPWNYPLVVLSQKLPFALAAGCSVHRPGAPSRAIKV